MPVLLLSSFESASTALEGKSAIYSHTPNLYFSSKVAGFGDLIVLQPDGPRHREGRRLVASVMGSRASLTRFTPTIEDAVRALLKRVLENPSDQMLSDHIRKRVSPFSDGYSELLRI
jgi:cytochrome P450